MSREISRLVGKRIREARARSGLSAPEFADMVGVGERVLRYWEAGRSQPPIARLVRIAVASDVPVSWMLMPLDASAHVLAYGEVPSAQTA